MQQVCPLLLRLLASLNESRSAEGRLEDHSLAVNEHNRRLRIVQAQDASIVLRITSRETSFMAGNCSRLKNIVNFESYVSILRNVTNNPLSAGHMEPCRQEICAALYGTGSSDVSGIGVSDRDEEKIHVADHRTGTRRVFH